MQVCRQARAQAYSAFALNHKTVKCHTGTDNKFHAQQLLLLTSKIVFQHTSPYHASSRR